MLNSSPLLRRSAAALLALALTTTAPAFAAETPSPLKPLPFADATSHWAAPVIAEMADRGIIQGFEDGTFRPDSPMTRAQFLALVLRVTDLNIDNIRFIKAPDPRDYAPDIEPTAWYADAVIIAGFHGLLPKDQPFRPEEPILRQEMAQLAVQALYAKAGPILLTQQFIIFKDGDQVDDGFMGPLQDAYKLRIMQGNDGFIDPRGKATRAQGVIVLKNLDNALKDHPPQAD